MANNNSGIDAFGGVSNRLQPRVFEDLRGWMDALRAEDELQEIDVQVDWDCELGTVARKAFGTGHGPAILFKNISGYNGEFNETTRNTIVVENADVADFTNEDFNFA